MEEVEAEALAEGSKLVWRSVVELEVPERQTPDDPMYQ